MTPHTAEQPETPAVLGDLIRQASGRAGGVSSGIVDTDGTMIEWTQVERSVRRLGAQLRDAGVEAGDRVAVFVPKSAASFIAVHAILRIGAVMVPLDPLGPVERLEQVMGAVSAAAIVARADTLLQKIPSIGNRPDLVIAAIGPTEALEQAGIDREQYIAYLPGWDEPVADVDVVVHPDDAAYIIFTSGSTGRPKGIVHTHASALAYAQEAARDHGLNDSSRLAGTSPLHFDMSTLELYAVPLAGATAVTVSEGDQIFPASLSAKFEAQGVTHLYAVPFQLTQIVERGDLVNRDVRAIVHVAFGGEQISPGTLTDLAAAFPHADLCNVYGPAEVNGVITHTFDRAAAPFDAVPIGAPWPNVDCIIVDDDDQPVAIGETGDLWVAGPSRMLGYWGDPERSQESFAGPDNRFYRTGDRVHQDGEGRYFFHGRDDNRIKVRGVRIELEEIEQALSDAPGVVHAVAGLVKPTEGLEHIHAWVSPEDGVMLSADDIIRWCRSRVPKSAIPAAITFVDDMPVTATGKIDRSAVRSSLGDN